MTDTKKPIPSSQAPLDLRIVDDVPDEDPDQPAEGMTPEEIQAFLAEPVGTEES